MRSLKQQVDLLTDLERQREIMAYRFYTVESQSCLLGLIEEEIETWTTSEAIPQNLYVALSNPEKYATKDIIDLCLLYRSIIIHKMGQKSLKIRFKHLKVII
jgi:hypothetical protein